MFLGGAGGDDDDDGDGGAGGGGGGGESEEAGGGLDWTVGRFAVFPMDASNPVPLLVGTIVEFHVGEEENEAILDWWSPVLKNLARSQYGEGCGQRTSYRTSRAHQNKVRKASTLPA